MADIYHILAVNDFRHTDTETLKSMSGQSEEAFSGVMAGIRTLGSLAFWAKNSDDYDDESAAMDLGYLSAALMILPRIAQALNDNAQNAQFELWKREGFPLQPQSTTEEVV